MPQHSLVNILALQPHSSATFSSYWLMRLIFLPNCGVGMSKVIPQLKAIPHSR